MSNNITNICINCGKQAEHKHHVVPRSLGGNDESNCVWLCDECHGLIHKINYSKNGLSHSQLTKMGLEKARAKGVHLGGVKGKKIHSPKEEPAKEVILEFNKDFNGTLNDIETLRLLDISRPTFYKYKKELKKNLTN